MEDISTVESAATAFESLLGGAADTQGEESTPAGAEPEEGEEQDAAPEPEESDDAEATEEEEEQPAIQTVEIDGKQVTLDELKRGFLREADYTRKTQDLASQRKAAESELETAKAERAHYASELQRVQDLAAQYAPREPDWKRLINEMHPTEVLRLQLEYGQQKATLQHLEQEAAAAAERTQAEQDKANQERIAGEQVKLAEAIPEWKDAKVAKTEKAALVEFAVANGYQPEELSEINDHRVVVLLRKAMLHDRFNAQKARLRPTAQPGPRPATPGGNVRQISDATRAKQRLAKTGDVHDAAAVMERFL